MNLITPALQYPYLKYSILISYLCFLVEWVKVVVIGKLLTSLNISKGKQTHPIQSIHIPEIKHKQKKNKKNGPKSLLTKHFDSNVKKYSSW